jgi:hypothetical protein
VIVLQLDRRGHFMPHRPDDDEEDRCEEDPHQRQEDDHVGLGDVEQGESRAPSVPTTARSPAP